jgi:hypothetical protein
MFPTALAWAQAQTAGSQPHALAEAYLSGARRVRFEGGREVEYRDGAEMEAAIINAYSANLPAARRRPAATLARLGGGV